MIAATGEESSVTKLLQLYGVSALRPSPRQLLYAGGYMLTVAERQGRNAPLLGPSGCFHWGPKPSRCVALAGVVANLVELVRELSALLLLLLGPP